MTEKRGCALFGGQYFCSSVTSISLYDSYASYSAAPLECVLSRRNKCGNTITVWFYNSACTQYMPACTCGCARYTYLHLWAWIRVCVSNTDTWARVKSSSGKLIISSLEERWLTEREAVNQHLLVEQKPGNLPSRHQGGSFWIKQLGFHPQLDLQIIFFPPHFMYKANL